MLPFDNVESTEVTYHSSILLNKLGLTSWCSELFISLPEDLSGHILIVFTRVSFVKSIPVMYINICLSHSIKLVLDEVVPPVCVGSIIVYIISFVISSFSLNWSFAGILNSIFRSTNEFTLLRGDINSIWGNVVSFHAIYDSALFLTAASKDGLEGRVRISKSRGDIIILFWIKVIWNTVSKSNSIRLLWDLKLFVMKSFGNLET